MTYKRYETSVIVNTEVPNDLPFNDYFEYFSPDFQLIPDPGPIKYDNLNNKPYLDNLKVWMGEGEEEMRRGERLKIMSGETVRKHSRASMGPVGPNAGNSPVHCAIRHGRRRAGTPSSLPLTLTFFFDLIFVYKDPEVRISQQQRDRMVSIDNEYYDDDEDNDQDDLDEI
jgi:hypothetical protein